MFQGNNPKVTDSAKSIVNEATSVNAFIQDKLPGLLLCPQQLEMSPLKSASCIRLLSEKLVALSLISRIYLCFR
jgi:hypothetical protein